MHIHFIFKAKKSGFDRCIRSLILRCCTGGGRGFFYSKATMGCAVSKGVLSRTSRLARGILFANHSLARGMLSGNFGQRKVNSGTSFIETENFCDFSLEMAKIWQLLSRKSYLMELLM